MGNRIDNREHKHSRKSSMSFFCKTSATIGKRWTLQKIDSTGMDESTQLRIITSKVGRKRVFQKPHLRQEV